MTLKFGVKSGVKVTPIFGVIITNSLKITVQLEHVILKLISNSLRYN